MIFSLLSQAQVMGKPRIDHFRNREVHYFNSNHYLNVSKLVLNLQIVVIPLRVNINLKTLTVGDLIQRRKVHDVALHRNLILV